MRAIWDISDKCNLRCKYCAATTISKVSTGKIGFDGMKKVIDNFSEMITEVSLLGGEPLLVPNIISVLEYLTLKKIRVDIITNGQTGREIFDSLEAGRIRIQNMQVSIDAFEQENDMNRGIGSYKKALAFLEKAIAERNQFGYIENVGISMVLTSVNKGCIKEYIKYAIDELGVNFITVSPVVINEKAEELNYLKMGAAEKVGLLKELSEYIIEHGYEEQVNIEVVEPLMKEYLNSECGTHYGIGRHKCKAVDEEIYIDAQGNLKTCRYGFKVGSLLDDSLESQYALFEKFVREKQHVKPMKCDCVYQKECNKCIFANETQLECSELCKYIQEVYEISKKAEKEQFLLCEPSLLYEDEGTYYGFFPKKNLKESYEHMGYNILDLIRNQKKTAVEIAEKVGISSEVVYRFLIQCFSKGIVRRVCE